MNTEKYEKMNTEKYQKEYSEAKLEAKLGKSKLTGKKLVLDVLKLYYSLKLGKLNVAQIAIAVGALGYFILSVDFIPDFILGLGWIDDAAVIKGALNAIGDCSDREVERTAEAKLSKLFG